MTQTTKFWLYIIAVNFVVLLSGFLISDRQGLLVALILVFGLDYLIIFRGERILLWTYGARRLEGSDPFGIFVILKELGLEMGVQLPRVFLAETDSPNCFVIGHSPETVALVVTEGALRILSREELKAVFAQQLQQLQSGQVFTMTVAAVIAFSLLYVADTIRFLMSLEWVRKKKKSSPETADPMASIFFSFFAPLAALFVHASALRQREFTADRQAIAVTKNPQALADALWKIHCYARAVPLAGNIATAHLFIVNPFAAGPWVRLFITHPPVEERIKRVIGRYPY
jgi:heat shock protein HtpX